MGTAMNSGMENVDLQPLAEREPASFTPRKALIAVAGGTGTEIGTIIKANDVADHGRLRPGTAVVALDVMPAPPVVVARRPDGSTLNVTLEPKREYLAIGKDLDPPRLSQLLRRQTQQDGDLRWLLNRQPGGRFAKSLDKGTEGERSFGYAAFLWSEREIEELVVAALRRLNDVRLADGRGGWVTDAPVDVFIVGSEAGGVGSAIALPFCRLIKQAMDELGMSVSRSFFTYVTIGPEAFPPKTLRSSNAAETLGDLAVAQVRGVIP